jgi:hypothetical protein
MPNPIRVMIEPGKKQKKVVAVAFDWPGWDRNGKTEEQARQTLESYRPRYRKVAELAGLAAEFDAAGQLAVVERAEPSSIADFYGVSGMPASAEQEQMSEAECERKLALLRACWSYFDDTWPRVSEELRNGPRGGGRDRDRIVRHTYGAEEEYARKVGVPWEPEVIQDPDRLRAYRETFLDAICAHNAEAKPARTWTLQFLIRRTSIHMLDHAWELEDKDLTPTA